MLITYLEYIEFKIVGFISRPEYRVIRSLGPVFHLSQTFTYIFCRLINGLSKKFILHKMRTGAGCQEAAIVNQLHCAQIYFTVAFDRIFYGIS